MGGGLIAGYGYLGVMAGRFLLPAESGRTIPTFVTETSRLKMGKSMPFVTAAGEKVVVARRGPGETADDFMALSSVCPHLGCQVFWEPQNNRFFCPCHNGTFAADGKPTGGPPLAGNQWLTQYKVRVENGLLFIDLPADRLTREQLASQGCGGHGDDPGDDAARGGGALA
ncbi:MAG: Rieske (2Fe-2S) protein [Planctomycetia bacterium]|nr:Rieske (2Fe-2S) protein [Planctomycetia bacterium]